MTFRKWYSSLSELRSLIPSGLPFIALTATASKKTKKEIWKVLEFASPYEVVESPDRQNIAYVSQHIDSGQEVNNYFGWLVEAVKENGENTERVLIYCQTVKQCASLYQLFANELSELMYSDKSFDPRKRLVEMLHSKTPASVKNTVLDSFSKENGHIRVLIATVAFGMGVNTKGVRTAIHVGPPKNLEAYVQESGRCGRDGEQSRAVILFNSKLSMHADNDMKEYLLSDECRRKLLRQPFDSSKQTGTSQGALIAHLCCDNCAKKCKFCQPGCPPTLYLPAVVENKGRPPLTKKRDVSAAQKELLRKKLECLQKSLVTKSIQGDQKERKATVLLCPNFFLEFTKTQINQVLENCAFISSIADVRTCAEIWQHKHAVDICNIFCEVFGDMTQSAGNDESDESEEDDDSYEELLQLQQDNSFLEMVESGLFNSLEETELMDDIDENANIANYPYIHTLHTYFIVTSPMGLFRNNYLNY